MGPLVVDRTLRSAVDEHRHVAHSRFPPLDERQRQRGASRRSCMNSYLLVQANSGAQAAR